MFTLCLTKSWLKNTDEIGDHSFLPSQHWHMQWMFICCIKRLRPGSSDGLPHEERKWAGRDKVLHYPCLSDELIHFSKGGISEGRKKS